MKKFFQRFLENKKVLASTILFAGIFGFFILVSRADENSSLFEPTTDLEEKNKDSDDDGLANWEEELLGTNPYKADTDGDGFLDGEEVASKHDPLIPAPDDNLYNLEVEEGMIEAIKEPKNLTEALVQNTAALAFSPDAPTNPESLVSLIKTSSDNSFFTQGVKRQLVFTLYRFMPPKIEEGELNVVYKNNKEDLESYTKKIESVMNSVPTAKNNISADQALILAVQYKKYDYVNQVAQDWQTLYQKIKDIEVPAALVDAHLDGLRGAYILSQAFSAITETDNDPAASIIAIKEISKGLYLINDTYRQIRLLELTFD